MDDISPAKRARLDQIYNLVVDGGGLTVQQIAAAAGLHRTAARNYLLDLEERGYVVRVEQAVQTGNGLRVGDVWYVNPALLGQS